jgi:hypothetical protein
MIGIAAIIAVFIVTYYVYQSAKEYGRNAVAWAALTFCLGFGIQLVIPFVVGMGIAIYFSIKGDSVEEIQEYVGSMSFLLGIVPMILSFVAIGLILKYVGTMPSQPTFVPPPQPPTFE